MDSWFPRTRMLRGKFSSRYASTTRIEIRVNLRKSIKLLDLRSIPPKDRQCPTGLVRLLRHFLRRYGSQTGRMLENALQRFICRFDSEDVITRLATHLLTGVTQEETQKEAIARKRCLKQTRKKQAIRRHHKN